jgi:hypothetical protein
VTPPEESLDPADWRELRALGHRMVDDMMDYLEQVRERPVWRSVPAESRAALDEPIPRGPTDPAVVYQQFREHILPYPNGNIHPRFWGWVILIRVQERGIAVPSSTVLGGRFALRVAITNHRSRREDFDLLVDAVLEAGEELTAD